MKIYFLRHEHRNDDVTPSSPLTAKGHENAQKLVDELSGIDFTAIFSSPYLRCLQTILPYVEKNNDVVVNVEFALVEYHHNKLLRDKLHLYPQTTLSKQIILNDPQIISQETIVNSFPETEELVSHRLKLFFDWLETKYGENDTILLVSHLHCGYMAYKHFYPNEAENCYSKFNLKMGELRMLI
jgi:broad specificity phosphatase PhoE